MIGSVRAGYSYVDSGKMPAFQYVYTTIIGGGKRWPC